MKEQHKSMSKQSYQDWLIQQVKNPQVILLMVGIVVFVVLAMIVPEFLTWRNITSILNQTSTTGLMAIGLTFVIITAGIDLSLPCVMAFVAIIGCMVMRDTQNVFLGVCSILLGGCLVGMFNGFSVSKLKMVPMIVTLAVQTAAAGLSTWVTGATSIGGLPSAFAEIFAGEILGFPVSAIIFIVVAVFMHILLTKTVFGRHLFQVGVNEKSAKVNGVKTERIVFIIYTISGLMAGLAGVLSAAKLNSAGASMGTSEKFTDIVCAVVLGGASVTGGKGSVIGSCIGAIFMTVISNVMNLYGVDYFITFIVKGTAIVLFTYFDVLRNRAAERR